ncbi:MAG: hypothetical protein LAO51_03930 [Acidobacteriia bacterium]|nr:hypothetical protein [Terriglobia bacterium]
MTLQRQKSKVVLDWFNVTYRSLGLAAAVVTALAAVALAAYWFYFAGAGPKAEAEEAIGRAASRLSEASTYRGDERLDEVRASARAALDEARTEFDGKRWDTSRVAAIRSENLSQKAIDMARGQGLVSQEVRFYRIEGDVRVKRAGEFAWESADRKMVLHLGDQVKTAASASVQLIYFDGTLTTIQAGSLLEIRDLSEDPATKVRKVTEKLNWGEATASTQRRNVEGSFHEVATEAASARTGDAGEFRIAYDKDSKKATFDAFSGRVEVAGPARREMLDPGERVQASVGGGLSAKDVLPGVPRLIAPSDQRVFAYDDPAKATTTLSWEKIPGAPRYHLMISDKVLFTQKLYDAERDETSVVIDGVASGSYYWKVAAVSASGVRGPFSEPRHFRVTSERIRDREDTTPPKLEITDFVQTGPMLIINGKTEPGALLWIDSEKVDVYEDGSFYAVIRLRKEGVNELHFVAQDAAGNEARLTHRAYVESY